MRFAIVVLVACGSESKPQPEPDPVPLDRSPVVGVAVVFNGQEIWVGNDDYERDEAATYRGWIGGLRFGFEKSPPARVLPKESKSLVVSFANEATIVKPIGPIAELASTAFGVQQDYRGKFGENADKGIELALAELDRAKVEHEIVIVIGNGSYMKPVRASPTTHIYWLRAGGSFEAPDDPTQHLYYMHSHQAFADRLQLIWREARQY